MTTAQILETARIPNSGGDSIVIMLAPSSAWAVEFNAMVKAAKPTLRIGEPKPTPKQVADASTKMASFLTVSGLSTDTRPLGPVQLEKYRAMKCFGDMRITRYIELKKLAEAGLLLRVVKPLEEVTK